VGLIHVIYDILIMVRLGPHKLAQVLNKCLDRFEHPDENVQPVQHPAPSSEPNLIQSTLIPQQAALSPPPPLPPMFDQPLWAETDLPQASSSPYSSNDATPTAGTPRAEGRALPIRPKLTIPIRSISRSSNVLITDDNLINRRVSILELVR
jgi:hypothetical protein